MTKTEYKVPFGGRSHEYTEEEVAAVVSVIRSRSTLTQGEYRTRFENKVSHYIAAGHAFAVHKATSA